MNATFGRRCEARIRPFGDPPVGLKSESEITCQRQKRGNEEGSCNRQPDWRTEEGLRTHGSPSYWHPSNLESWGSACDCPTSGIMTRTDFTSSNECLA